MASTKLPQPVYERGSNNYAWRYGAQQLTGRTSADSNAVEFRSYSTLVSVYDKRTNILYTTNERYSVTTARHVRGIQLLYHDAECYEKTPQGLRELARRLDVGGDLNPIAA